MTKAKHAVEGDHARGETLRDVVEATRLNRPVRSVDEALVLSLLYTRKLMDVISLRFFTARSVTEAEFGALMVLYDYRRKPLKQAELAAMLLVTRLSARDVLMRLERKGLVEPTSHDDARARAIRISKAGEKTLLEVRAAYYAMIEARLGGMKASEKRGLLEGLLALRGNLKANVDG